MPPGCAVVKVTVTWDRVKVGAVPVPVPLAQARVAVPERVWVRVVTRLVLVIVVVEGVLLLLDAPVMLGASSTADAVMVTKSVAMGAQAPDGSAKTRLLLVPLPLLVVLDSTAAAETVTASTLVVAVKPAADMDMELWEAITGTIGVMETTTAEGVDETVMAMAERELEAETGGVLGAPYGRSQGPAPSPHSPQVSVDVL